IIPIEEVVDETALPPSPGIAAPATPSAPPAEAPPAPGAEPAAAPETAPTPPAETDGTFVDPEFAVGAPAAESAPAQAQAQEAWIPSVEFGGEIRSRLGQDLAYEYAIVRTASDRPPVAQGREDVIDWRSSFAFWTRLGLSEHIQSYLELYAEHSVVGKRSENGPTVIFNGEAYRHALRLDLREAYFDFFFGPFHLRAGNQIVAWGTLAQTSPSDRVNPLDPRAFYWSDIGGLREPVLALRGIYNWNDLNFELLWIPIFTPPPVEPYGGDFALIRYDSAYGFTAYPIPDIDVYVDSSKTSGALPDLLSTKEPNANPLNSQAGLRFSGTKGGVDFGLSYLFAYEFAPATHFDPEVRALADALLQQDTNLATAYIQGLLDRLKAGEDVENLVQSEYRRKHSVAAEFGTTVWEFGLKAEMAFLPDKTYYTAGLVPVEHHTLAYAAGVDVLKTDLGALSTLYLDFELFGSTLFGVPAGEQLVFTSDRSLGLFSTLRFAFLDDDLELEATGQVQFATREFIVIPKISYKIIQGLRLSLGLMLIDSWAHEAQGFDRYASNPDRKDTLLGQYSNNDQVFFMVKYNF
ncbi:MAG: hypothetical protein C4523_04830, partial [Myxococcales bacterium]